MNSTVYLQIGSLIYFVFLLIIYFCKKRVNNIETKFYSVFLFVNLIGLIIDILLAFASTYININSISYVVLAKMYLIYFITWVALLFGYMYLLFKKSKDLLFFKSKNQMDFGILFMLIFYTVNIILVVVFPNYFNVDKYGTHSYGLATYYTYLVSIVYIVLALIFIFIGDFKKNIIKYLPIVIFVVLLIIATIIQQQNPSLIFIPTAMTLTVFLMYFTIENPDVKMINQLELAKNTAEQANRAKSDFISSMSHEIRTPLNAIVGFSEFIQTEQDPKEREEDAKNILMASQNLLEIVNGVLDISKIEAEKMEVVESEYELVPILDNLSDLMIPRIGEKEIELKTEFAKDIPLMLYGDKTKVKQIITNLLTNAVKYTEKGIINFKVNCINQKGICTLRIVVSDTGRGIKKEQMNRLFTKFQRLDEDKNTTIEGTGLGLAITKSLVEMMGGNINVQSVYGSGSTFTVNLSQKIVDKTINNSDEEKTKDIDFSGKRIIVVDDNNLNLLVAKKTLKKYKLNVVLVTSGFDLLNRIEDNEHYDLILIDDMMPKMSGKDTFKKLKENKDFNTPVVVLTANAIKGMKENYLNIGFNDYLSKPIDKDELEKVLSKYLGSNNNVEVKEINEVKEETVKNVSSDAKVLIVDDNNLNIKIAKNMLGDYSFIIDSCNSGKECIDKIKSNNHYDLILMDDMMPELSGPETLNELKKINNFNIPVISLTANKEHDNTREYYLDLGFDEYIGKPIDKKVLNDVINKILKINNCVNEEEQETENKNNNEVYKITDEDIAKLNEKLIKTDSNESSNVKGNIDYLKNNKIDIEASLELLGDVDTYNETLNMFIQENKTRISRIEENKNKGNMKDYSIDVHALKSDSKYLGFKRLAELSLDHELKSKENDINYINEHYNELMNEYNKINNIISKYL